MLLVTTKNDKEMKQYLEEHRHHVAAQINKLKILKDYLHVAKPALARVDCQSTPMVANDGKRASRLGLDMFSPIVAIPERDEVEKEGMSCVERSSVGYSLKDVSSWVGGERADLL